MRKFKCLLCGNETGYNLIKMRTRNSEHNIVACTECGLQQLYPLPSLEEDKKHYDLNPHDKEITPNFNIEDIYKKFEWQNRYRVNYLQKDIKIQKDWKILDYGCGYGFLIEILKESGYHVEGLEISADRLEVIKKRQGSLDDIYTYNFLDEKENIPIELQEKFDLVTSFHLIEHITSPVYFLKKIQSLIKKDGYILLELPNIENTLMDLSPEFNDFNYIRDHVAYYSPKLIRRVVEEAGFDVIAQKGVQMYGLLNYMNWVINGTPQLNSPSYEVPAEISWLENYFRQYLTDNICSEFMYILGRKK